MINRFYGYNLFGLQFFMIYYYSLLYFSYQLNFVKKYNKKLVNQLNFTKY